MTSITNSFRKGAGDGMRSAVTRIGFVPFTTGPLVFIYAFFWPESYGHWLGTIVHAFRAAAGV